MIGYSNTGYKGVGYSSSAGYGGVGYSSAEEGESVIFQDFFERGTLGGNWDLDNLGALNGVTFDMTGSEARWNCDHTALTVQRVVDNNISTVNSFPQDYLVLIASRRWTNTNPINAQFEHGFFWDDTNRISFGNEGANSQNFIRIKINNVNVFNENHPQDIDTITGIVYDKSNELVSFYQWNGASWSILEEDVDISPYTLPVSDPKIIFGAGGERNNRTGGDSSLLDYVQLYNQDITTINP